VVHSAEYNDIQRLVDIEFFAFENEKTNHVLSYRDHNQPDHFERTISSYQSLMHKAKSFRRRAKSRQAERRTPANNVTQFRKVMDEDTGVIVSWAKTEMKTYTPAELASPADCGHENDPQMNRDWFALNERLRRDYMGTRPHCCKFRNSEDRERTCALTSTIATDVGMLATQPCFQRVGAGTLLLELILAEADQTGVECYLEATGTAKPLYERHGFVEVNVIRFDPASYGIHGYNVEVQTIMVRPALDESGRRKQVRTWDTLGLDSDDEDMQTIL
jgi:GNAT superfamily N-acetyltransferase